MKAGQALHLMHVKTVKAGVESTRRGKSVKAVFFLSVVFFLFFFSLMLTGWIITPPMSLTQSSRFTCRTSFQTFFWKKK